MSRFVVLRDRQQVTGPFRGGRAAGPEGRAFSPSEPLIEVEDVDRKGRAELLGIPRSWH